MRVRTVCSKKEEVGGKSSSGTGDRRETLPGNPSEKQNTLAKYIVCGVKTPKPKNKHKIGIGLVLHLGSLAEHCIE